jgi:hypothetical protein
MTYTKHDWFHLETISETNIDHLETQFDEARADYQGGLLVPSATIPMGSQSISGIKSINETELYSSAFPTLQEGIDAANGKRLIIDKSWTLSGPARIISTNDNTQLIGVGEKVVTISAGTWTDGSGDGVLRIKGRNCVVGGFSLEGNTTLSALDVGENPLDSTGSGDSLCFSAYNMNISNSAYAIRQRDNSFYSDFRNIRMMDGIASYSVWFDDDNGNNDNGQSVFDNCEMDGGYGIIKRTYTSSAATRHRIKFDRCGLYGGWASGHGFQFDAKGIYETLMISCDYEGVTSGYDSASVRLDGQYTDHIHCQFSMASNYSASNLILHESVFAAGTKWNNFLFCTGQPLTGISTGSVTRGNYMRFYGCEFKNWDRYHIQPLRIVDDRYWTGMLPPLTFQEEFMGKELDTKFWSFSGVGATYSFNPSVEAGEIILSVSATAGNKATLDWGGIKNFLGNHTTSKGTYFVANFSLSNESTSFSIGLRADDSNYTVFRNVGLYWYAVCVNAGVTNSYNIYPTSPIVANQSYTLLFELTTHSAYFIIDNDAYRRYTYTGSSYNYTSTMEPYVFISASDANARMVNIQYIHILAERHY